MKNKIIKLIILAGLTLGLLVGVLSYENGYLLKSLYTLIGLTILYVVFKFLFEEVVARHIAEPATRYSFRRAVSAFFFIAAFLVIITVWIDARDLLIAYGLIGAGVAVALQDFFKNVAGGLVIFIRGHYRVGDRIEVNSRFGDVIDVDLLNTTLLEIKEWVTGDQPTGRLCLIPNGFVLSHPVHNYTKDHQFIWDEIHIPVTFGSDWKLASDIIRDVVTRETEIVTRQAQQSLSGLSGTYYLPERAEVPYVYSTITDNWISLTVRYVTEVRNRRPVNDRLNRLILEEIERAGKDKIQVSSETLTVSLSDNE